MDDQTLELRIRAAAEHAAPDVLDRVLSACDGQNGTTGMKQAPEKQKRRWMPLAVAAALILACTGTFGWGSWRTANTVDSVIMLDVNPSISLTVNADEKVISAQALNKDAEIILGEMDLKGTGLDVAVNALIGSMLQHGYLDMENFENSILVSVENSDQERAAQLQAQVSGAISRILKASDITDPLILTQSVNSDDALTALAGEYSISTGKAALIQEVVAQDASLTFEALAPLSVNEIVWIADSRGLSIETVTQSGHHGGWHHGSGAGACIGENAARDCALSHANCSLSDVDWVNCYLDYEGGVPYCYEVEFVLAGTKYEYEIGYSDGTVLSFEREPYSTAATSPAPSPGSTPAPSASPSPSPSAPAGGYIGEEAARDCALRHASCALSDAANLSCWMEYDDGVPECYQVEFTAGGMRYEYEIGLYDGAVIKYESEACNSNGYHGGGHHGGGHHGGTAAGTDYIGESAAQNAAFAHAGVSAADVYALEVELDYDGGTACYEVNFKAGNLEYEYEISAVSGAILKAESDPDD